MTTSQPHFPPPWMLTRLQRPSEEGRMQRLDIQIRIALRQCVRCSSVYEQTGLIPVLCDVCGAERDVMWITTLESLLEEPEPVSQSYTIPIQHHVISDEEAP